MAYQPYEVTKKYDNKPRRQFTKQRYNAIKRGIEWELTFDEWLSFWGEDLNKRGCKKGQMVMARIEDQGPYAIWNIYKEMSGINTSQGKTKEYTKWPCFNQ